MADTFLDKALERIAVAIREAKAGVAEATSILPVEPLKGVTDAVFGLEERLQDLRVEIRRQARGEIEGGWRA